MSLVSLRLVPASRYTPRTHRQVLIGQLSTALTFGRIPVAAIVVLATAQGVTWLAVTSIAAFVGWDILDGMIARKFDAETSFRRGLDGVVDKVSIHAAALVAIWPEPAFVIAWSCLLVRDVAQGIIGYRIFSLTRIMAAGAKWHRSFTLFIAVWGVCLILDLDAIAIALIPPMLIVGVATLIDYSRLVRKFCQQLAEEEVVQLQA